MRKSAVDLHSGIGRWLCLLMGFLDYVLGFSSQAPSIFPNDPNDDRAWRPQGNREYWGGFSGPTLTGNYVNPDDAIGVSCVFAAIRIWCNVLGSVPIKFYRRQKNGEETPLPNYRLAEMFSTDGVVNPWQTSVVWRMWGIAQQMLWGVGLSDIKFGAGGLELWPIEGAHISRLEQLDSGKLRFTISEPGKVTRPVTQDQVLRVDAFSTHKSIPESVLRRSREAVGTWLAQEQYRSLYYRSGASPSVVFTHPGPMLGDKAIARLKAQLQARVGGNSNAHKVVITDEGMTAKSFGTTAKDSLLVDAWNNQVLEFSRLLGVPAFMLSATTQLPYNSRESAMKEWLDTEVRPRARLIEASYKRDLFVEDGVVCEHDLGELQLGDALAQQQADTGYINSGVDSVNEVRSRRGMPKLPGDEYDLPRRSANIGTDPGGDNRPNQRPGDPITPPPSPPIPPGAPPTPPQPGNKKKKGSSVVGEVLGEIFGESVGEMVENVQLSEQRLGNLVLAGLVTRHRQVVTSTARTLLNRETDQIRRRAVQLASDTPAFNMWLREFYAGHARHMVERLALETETVLTYTTAHRKEVEAQGISVCERWETNDEALDMMVEMATASGEER